jgi:hypothetical protein
MSDLRQHKHHRRNFMGAKTWMLVYANGAPSQILKSKPALDRAASMALAQRLFPSERLDPLEDGTLSFTNPPDEELLVGCFPGASIVAAKEFAIDYPSRLPEAFIDSSLGNTVYLHAMHSVVDWFAYAIWRNGRLERSLSLSPDSGVLESIGTQLPFEEPYWEGQHPAVDPEEEPSGYPFAFHPLELGEAALLEFFGYQLEGFVDSSHFEPEEIPLMRFKRSKLEPAKQSKSWWRRW